MNYLHHLLLDKYHWYKKWHDYPLHNHFHWFLFLFTAIIIALFFNSIRINNGKVTEVLSVENPSPNFNSYGPLRGKVIRKATDRILVQFKDSTSDDKRKEILDRHNLKEKETIKGTKVKIISLPSGNDPVELVEKLKKDETSFIDFAETDDLVSPEFIPNDQYFSNQWHLPKIEAPAAWDRTSAQNTVVGICDTGVDGGHQDLAPVLRADLGFNTVDNSSDWSPVHYHGTMVAGAAAAAVNNSIGVAGVGRDAKIIPVRISNYTDGSAYLSDAAECISYSADNGVRVINLSYNMAGSYTIDSATSFAEGKNAVTLVAAGNDGSDPGWPDFSTFIAVGASDQNDTRPSWSNYGNYIDIVAPGISILTSYPGNQYAYASGTSLSTPLVVGTIALLSGAKPDITVSEIKNTLYTTADDLGEAGDDTIYGSGRVNAKKAVEKLLGSLPTPNLSPTITPVPDTVPPTVSITYPTNKSRISPNSTVNITATASDNIWVKQVDIRVSIVTKISGNKVTLNKIHQCIDDADPYSCTWNVPNQRNVTYLIQAIANDLAGNSAISQYVQFTVR